jgi:hypothetical protein
LDCEPVSQSHATRHRTKRRFLWRGIQGAKLISLDIYNLKGQKVHSANISNPDVLYRIPEETTFKLGSGSYIFSVKMGGEPVSTKKRCITK